MNSLRCFFLLVLGATCLVRPGPRAMAESSPSGVSDTARLICGATPDGTYDARIRAVATLGKTLPAADFFALQNFLEKTPAADTVTPDQLNAIKNDVAAKLLACEYLPDGFSRRFLAMASAPGVGLVWQNYTIQFLDVLWVRENDTAMRRRIFDTLLHATGDTRLTIPGTALLTLSRLPTEAGLTPGRLGDLAMRAIANDAIPWQDKITALHVAADAGDARALARARAWAADNARPVMLRMASFAVLGKMGVPETDGALLERHARSGEFRLRSAARAALKKLSQHPVSAYDATAPKK
ncbi:MAG: hypothetical protein LBD14_02830 [Puniceicoccales bacterium]|nr:hypothetical protein [Puniceicoccales bacterium]